MSTILKKRAVGFETPGSCHRFLHRLPSPGASFAVPSLGILPVMPTAPVPSKTPRKTPRPRWVLFFQGYTALSLIALTVVLAPLIVAPVTSRLWHGAQTLGMEIGAAAVLASLLARPWSLASVKCFVHALSFFPLLCLHLFFVWTLVSATRTADPAFAVQGMLPLAAGVLIADVVAVQARAVEQCLFILDAFLGAGLLVALLGVALYGSSGMQIAAGVFQDHQLFGAFSMLIIPFALSVSLAPVGPVRKSAAQAAAVVCLAALLTARCRSAWIGEAFALLTLGGLLVFAEAHKPMPQASFVKRRRVLRYGLAVAAALIGFVAAFIALSPERAVFLARAETAAAAAQDHDASLQWRRAVWAGTERMISQKPLQGWGAGSYPLRHYPFTKTGHRQEAVHRDGPSIEDEAHNFYLQTAAESGIIGLALWLTFCVTLIGFSVLRVPRLASDPLRQQLLIGGVSALVGQMVDALANPGWQFGSVTLFLWIVLGLLLSSAAPPLVTHSAKPPQTANVMETTKVVGWPQRIVAGLVGLGIGCGLARLILQTAFALPAPHL